MNELPSGAVVLAALISGIIGGLTTSTNTEHKLRGTTEDLLFPLFPIRSAFGIIINVMLWLLIVSIAVTVPAMLIIHMGNAYPLSKIDRLAFVTFWFLSAFCAKYLRYRYWKKKFEKS